MFILWTMVILICHCEHKQEKNLSTKPVYSKSYKNDYVYQCLSAYVYPKKPLILFTSFFYRFWTCKNTCIQTNSSKVISFVSGNNDIYSGFTLKNWWAYKTFTVFLACGEAQWKFTTINKTVLGHQVLCVIG